MSRPHAVIYDVRLTHSQREMLLALLDTISLYYEKHEPTRKKLREAKVAK